MCSWKKCDGLTEKLILLNYFFSSPKLHYVSLSVCMIYSFKSFVCFTFMIERKYNRKRKYFVVVVRLKLLVFVSNTNPSSSPVLRAIRIYYYYIYIYTKLFVSSIRLMTQFLWTHHKKGDRKIRARTQNSTHTKYTLKLVNKEFFMLFLLLGLIRCHSLVHFDLPPITYVEWYFALAIIIYVCVRFLLLLVFVFRMCAVFSISVCGLFHGFCVCFCLCLCLWLMTVDKMMKLREEMNEWMNEYECISYVAIENWSD